MRGAARAERRRQQKTQDSLESGAAARQTIAPEDLMIVGGKKIDLSKDLSAEVLEEDNPEDYLPRLVTAGGKVYDLDKGEEIKLDDTIEIDGRALRIGAFGGDAAVMVWELYEQFLKACQNGLKSEYRKLDGTGEIIDCLAASTSGSRLTMAGAPWIARETEAKRMIQTRMDPNMESVSFVDWGNPHVTFEQWMVWAAATIRWRVRVDLPNRYERQIDIRKRETMQDSKNVLEPTLVAIEKFLALPERKRLTAV
jgi:hypothetical protein